MSTDKRSIFRPRKARKTKKSATPESGDPGFVNTTSQIYELTKTNYYCISRLPALPNVLSRKPDTVLNGYADGTSSYSVVVSKEGIYVWCYKSTDSSPLTIEFPIEDAQGILPLAILTNPSSGSSKDPGIVIINSSSRVLKFFESVQHSPALGLIGNKDLEISLPIESERGEFITLAENVEPAGIIIVTSWKRVLLVNLRDRKNKPALSLVSVIKPASNFLSRFFKRDDINDDIVCTRSGNLNNAGTQQQIVIQEKSGLFHLITVQLSSTSGHPFIDWSLSFTHNMNTYVESNIDGFNKLATQNIQYLDTWRINNISVEDTYLILCLITDQFKKSDNDLNNLVLITAKINKSGVLVYGSHRTNRFDGSIGDIPPKLFVPYPQTTAFILLKNSLILTELDYSYISQKGTVSYYKPRWEDIIKLKDSVDVIGYGYENQSTDSNSALILLTESSGVLRIEKFSQGSTGDSLKPVNLVKSHIEQAIFYSKDSSIDFNLTGKFSQETIDEAVSQIIQEIMGSNSQYLPKFSPTISSLLENKAKLLINLIEYCNANFPLLGEHIKINIIYELEKTQTSQHVWGSVDSGSERAVKLRKLLKEVVLKHEPTLGSSDDGMRRYFNNKTDSINLVFTDFLTASIKADVSADFLLNLITKVLYESIMVNEIKYAQDIASRKSWIFDTDLLLDIEKFFDTNYCNDSIAFTNPIDVRGNISQLCNALHYFINEAIDYMKEESNESLTKYVKWYNKNKVKWIQCLLSNNLGEDAIEMVEKYQNFTSLASIIEEEREKTAEIYGLDSAEYQMMLTKYYVYFERYQYSFASALFDYYIKNDKIQIFLTGFPRYKHLLDQYLESKYDMASNVAWIRKLLDGEYADASRYLLRSAEINGSESQNNQELKYSLAKLSAMASETAGKMDVDSTLFRIETKLILIRIQRSLFQYVNEAVIKSQGDEDLKLKMFLKFVNNALDQSAAQGIFQHTFPDFINNKTLGESVLIDYLTFVRPSSKFNNGFSNAFRVASLLPDEATYKLETKKIWCRLLSITEDWSELNSTSEKTDAFVTRKLKSSVLFKTVLSIHDKEIHILEQMLKEEEPKFNQDNVLLFELDNSFFHKSVGYAKKYNILNWIHSIKTETDLNI
ncbi:hypothetical protein PSN45_002480 [Yamadazyma tenuis]|uniref:Nucleoporin Nup133/Nup155-like N-terminal domain-containing protein n=1 Tax=Candida tenuis (strain ATCC 10573 / BCRC 21748 / CBS 615 / JCM 9827 / NBRC 10315 / NRRL Y-1498 / VKM Y-70) TaxID=590646 RepID=G3B0B7_CANTC|nr:uncharacterized protein CANTEDRAFT_119662 [Yamadazyma tenuis ATCC 10573]EGV65363.1 hypothetical protein CANTEDRAFT_119662 [Yamadazyma tenuis ATCC 10573]WEJ94976.1 hypothetical protein PSN45_002480 [Yamadazyma tenuis]